MLLQMPVNSRRSCSSLLHCFTQFTETHAEHVAPVGRVQAVTQFDAVTVHMLNGGDVHVTS